MASYGHSASMRTSTTSSVEISTIGSSAGALQHASGLQEQREILKHFNGVQNRVGQGTADHLGLPISVCRRDGLSEILDARGDVIERCQRHLCCYTHCPAPMHSKKWRIVTKDTNAGARNWMRLVGLTLCDSCYSTFRKHGTFIRSVRTSEGWSRVKLSRSHTSASNKTTKSPQAPKRKRSSDSESVHKRQDHRRLLLRDSVHENVRDSFARVAWRSQRECSGDELSAQLMASAGPFRIGVRMKQVNGVLSIMSVSAGESSVRAGICAGDVVLTIGGEAVSSLESVRNDMVRCSNDASVTLRLRKACSGVSDIVVLRSSEHDDTSGTSAERERLESVELQRHVPVPRCVVGSGANDSFSLVTEGVAESFYYAEQDDLSPAATSCSDEPLGCSKMRSGWVAMGV